MTDHKKWLTVKETAIMINVHDRTIRRYISEGKLESKKDGKRVLIDIDSINDLDHSKDHSKDHRQSMKADQENVYDQIILQEVELLRDKVKGLEADKERLERQIEGLQTQLQEASHEHNTIIMQMTKMLEFERLPFWKRWRKQKALPVPGDVMDIEK